ncbi:MAG: SIMPL domain-containing protein [Muribaculaceae bacterium]|nr:SIMPL domain-containing protein [Muribaculaceae bacterium]
MKKFVMAVSCAALMFSSLTVLPAGALCDCEKDTKGSVSVAYTAEKEVSPDTAEISIAVKTEDKKSMSEAVRKNKEVSEQVYAYVKSMITPSNGDYIKTSNFSASPSYVYNNGKRTLDKYVVSNNIIVHTKSIDKISTVIDKSLTLGATNVDSLNFSLSEKDEECAKLLTKAAKEARKRADVVAAASGSSVVGVKNIDTSCSVNRSGNYAYARNTLMMAKSAGAMEDAAMPESSPNIEAGVIKIYSSVNATYYLK